MAKEKRKRKPTRPYSPSASEQTGSTTGAKKPKSTPQHSQSQSPSSPHIPATEHTQSSASPPKRGRKTKKYTPPPQPPTSISISSPSRPQDDLSAQYPPPSPPPLQSTQSQSLFSAHNYHLPPSTSPLSSLHPSDPARRQIFIERTRRQLNEGVEVPTMRTPAPQETSLTEMLLAQCQDQHDLIKSLAAEMKQLKNNKAAETVTRDRSSLVDRPSPDEHTRTEVQPPSQPHTDTSIQEAAPSGRQIPNTHSEAPRLERLKHRSSVLLGSALAACGFQKGL